MPPWHTRMLSDADIGGDVPSFSKPGTRGAGVSDLSESDGEEGASAAQEVEMPRRRLVQSSRTFVGQVPTPWIAPRVSLAELDVPANALFVSSSRRAARSRTPISPSLESTNVAPWSVKADTQLP